MNNESGTVTALRHGVNRRDQSKDHAVFIGF